MPSDHNMSKDEDQWTAVSEDEYHKQIAIVMTPGMVILGLLLLTGFVGNVLVLYVYIFRLKRSTTNLFIASLAVSDTVVCAVCIPIEIVVIRYLYSFDRPWLCRVMRTIVLFCVICSIVILITVAVDRYRRICTPFAKQITLQKAKIVIGAGCVVAAVLASPSMVILGSKTVNKTFIGHACATDDSMISTPYPGLFNGMQLLIAVVGTATFTTLYALILRRIKVQERYKQTLGKQVKDKQNSDIASDDQGTTGTTGLEVDTAMEERTDDETASPISSTDGSGTVAGIDNVTVNFVDENVTSYDVTVSPRRSSNTSDVPATKSKARSRLWSGSHRTTFMMFLITAVFVVSFLPHLGLMATRAAQGHTFGHLEGVPLALYQLFLRSYFINSASNPIIYSFLSKKFRREMRILFCRVTPQKTAV